MTPKYILAILNIVYFTLVVGLTAFAGFVLVWISVNNEAAHDAHFETTLQYIVIAALLIGASIGHLAYKAILKKIPASLPLAARLHRYQSAVLVRAAGLEIPGLAASVAALLTGNASFLLFSAVVIVVFILFRPAVGTIVTDLQLTPHEKDALVR